MENQHTDNEKVAVQKRKAAAEEMKASRERKMAPDENSDALDHLLAELRNGKTVSRKARRARPTAATEIIQPPSEDPVDAAQALLAQMQGLDAFMPQPPSIPPPRRRRRRKPSENDMSDFGMIPASPLSSETDTGLANETLSETEDMHNEDGDQTIRFSLRPRPDSASSSR